MALTSPGKPNSPNSTYGGSAKLGQAFIILSPSSLSTELVISDSLIPTRLDGRRSWKSSMKRHSRRREEMSASRLCSWRKLESVRALKSCADLDLVKRPFGVLESANLRGGGRSFASEESSLRYRQTRMEVTSSSSADRSDFIQGGMVLFITDFFVQFVRKEMCAPFPKVSHFSSTCSCSIDNRLVGGFRE